jgi:protein-tyrosine phosphatase
MDLNNYQVTPYQNQQSNVSPAMMGIIQQLIGNNPQAIMGHLMPMIAPYITPHIDGLIKERMSSMVDMPHLKKEKSGVDLLLELTDQLIPSALQTNMIANPHHIVAVLTHHQPEIKEIAKKIEEIYKKY